MSPFKHLTQAELEKSQAETLITAIDDTYSQTVHSRSSHTSEEIVWGARFADLVQYSDGGLVSADLQPLSDVEQAGELS